MGTGYKMQTAVCILYLVCILYPVCSLQSAVCSLHFVLTDYVSTKCNISWYTMGNYFSIGAIFNVLEKKRVLPILFRLLKNVYLVYIHQWKMGSGRRGIVIIN